MPAEFIREVPKSEVFKLNFTNFYCEGKSVFAAGRKTTLEERFPEDAVTIDDRNIQAAPLCSTRVGQQREPTTLVQASATTKPLDYSCLEGTSQAWSINRN